MRSDYHDDKYSERCIGTYPAPSHGSTDGINGIITPVS